MHDHLLPPQNTGVIGMTGSGKTTLVVHYMLNAPAVCRLIFDDEDRTAPRLRLKPCYTLNELEDSLAGGWSVFNCSRMFPFDERLDRGEPMNAKRRAFRWWIAWVKDCCERGPGKKIISIPEIWRFCTPDSIPAGFATIMQMGRELDTHTIWDTQRPELVNGSVLGQTTEFISFKMLPTGMPDCPVKIVRRIFPTMPAIESEQWPMGQFWSINRLSGGTVTGRMF
jgi:hypothetical protein